MHKKIAGSAGSHQEFLASFKDFVANIAQGKDLALSYTTAQRMITEAKGLGLSDNCQEFILLRISGLGLDVTDATEALSGNQDLFRLFLVDVNLYGPITFPENFATFSTTILESREFQALDADAARELEIIMDYFSKQPLSEIHTFLRNMQSYHLLLNLESNLIDRVDDLAKFFSESSLLSSGGEVPFSKTQAGKGIERREQNRLHQFKNQGKDHETLRQNRARTRTTERAAEREKRHMQERKLSQDKTDD